MDVLRKKIFKLKFIRGTGPVTAGPVTKENLKNGYCLDQNDIFSMIIFNEFSTCMFIAKVMYHQIGLRKYFFVGPKQMPFVTALETKSLNVGG